MECRICLIPDPGNHNRESCCRACAAFFRRTVQLRLRYMCKRTGNCKVTKDNRYFCKYCRMKRCIAAGMTSPEDPSDSFDFYLDDSPAVLPGCSKLQESSSHESLPSLTDDDIFSEENVLKNYSKFSLQYQERLNEVFSKAPTKSKLPFDLALYQQAMLAYESHKQKWPNCTKEKIFTADVVDVGAFFCINLKEVLHEAEFCMEFEHFAQLPMDQKMLLLEHLGVRFMHLDRAFITIEILGTDIEDTRTVYFNGQAADCSKTKLDVSKISDFKAEDVVRLILSGYEIYQNYMNQFKKLNPDYFELMYMLMTTLWDVRGINGISPETVSIAEKEQERLCEELMFYYKFEKKLTNYASRIYKMKNVFVSLDKIDEMRKEDNEMVKTFEMFNIDVNLADCLNIKDD